MNKSVFVSSTYEDLKEHRKAVWDLLSNYNVQIRGMEQFGARTSDALSTCLAECEQSDVYIGIIGMRFGSIEESSGKSFTQIEYEKAYERGKEILIFVVNEDDSQILISNIDFGEKHDKLLEFKKTLSQRHTIVKFVSPQDLVKQLRLSIEKLVESVTSQIDQDDPEQSRLLINRFLLTPITLSGKKVKLSIILQGNAFPASKAICETFNLRYGATVGFKIEIRSPKVDNLTDYLFMDSDDYDLLDDKTKNLTILATLRFSQRTVESFRANFIRKEYFLVSATIQNPFITTRADTKHIVNEAEGTMILELAKIIDFE